MTNFLINDNLIINVDDILYTYKSKYGYMICFKSKDDEISISDDCFDELTKFIKQQKESHNV